MVAGQTWVIIGITIVIMAILLLLPQQQATKIIGVLSVMGIMVGAYSFFQSSRTQKEQLALQETARNDQYFTDIITRFRDPELYNDFKAIYGDDIPPNEFILFTYIAQAIENLNIQLDFVNKGVQVDPVWINVMKRWVSHPLFPLYFKQNADQYDESTRELVNLLLSGQI